jgi:tRNA(Leu) C34 or U34 (ribose-2'-O)-methylase TrmL
MMIRSACLFGAEKFYTFGRKKYDKRSTVGAEKYIDIVQYTYDDPMTADESILQDICEIQKNNNYEIVLCEQGGMILGSEEYDMVSSSFSNPLFLFGSESFGIPENILNNESFYKISIPQKGVLRSFNVSAAMNIIAWDYIKNMDKND